VLPAPQRLHFDPEARQALGGMPHTGQADLQGHHPVEGGLAGLINHPPAAPA
jgi:hypothetical protein